MKELSSKPKIMTVAGGHQLTTKFGSFRVKIGPSINGGKKVTECQGVNLIAGNLDKQDLDEVNEELRTMDLLDPSVPLPKYAGGGEVGVLLGIQDVQLDPVLIAVLPSGTGLYRCPFVDIWGSQFAYGGPHPSFSTPTNVGHMSSLFMAIKKKTDTRRSCRNPDLCHLAPPGWGDYARGLVRHRPTNTQPGHSWSCSKL